MTPAERDEEGTWEVADTADGSWTLVHPGHGQACHSRAGAWGEAVERYALPCGIEDAARRRGTVRLLDVGTGLGLNVAAALRAARGGGGRLEVDTFEARPDVLRAAVETRAARAGLTGLTGGAEAAGPEPWHARVCAALAEALEAEDPAAGVGLGPGGSGGLLRLHLGDARERIEDLPPGARCDAVFLDPFSPAVEPGLWEGAFLAALASRMAAGAILSTYTSSLEVRARLVRAGLACGPGPRVGTKSGGTVAVRGAAPPRAFDGRTARKLARRVERLDAGEGPRPETDAGRRVQSGTGGD